MSTTTTLIIVLNYLSIISEARYCTPTVSRLNMIFHVILNSEVTIYGTYNNYPIFLLPYLAQMFIRITVRSLNDFDSNINNKAVKDRGG